MSECSRRRRRDPPRPTQATTMPSTRQRAMNGHASLANMPRERPVLAVRSRRPSEASVRQATPTPHSPLHLPYHTQLTIQVHPVPPITHSARDPSRRANHRPAIPRASDYRRPCRSWSIGVRRKCRNEGRGRRSRCDPEPEPRPPTPWRRHRALVGNGNAGAPGAGSQPPARRQAARRSGASTRRLQPTCTGRVGEACSPAAGVDACRWGDATTRP
jgi:hypothetical protein